MNFYFKHKRGGIIILIFLLKMMYNPMLGQESLGQSLGNYSGIWGGHINPASLTLNKVFIDVNLVGASTHFSNNFGYIPHEDYSLFGLITADTIIPRYGKYMYNGYYTYFNNRNDKWARIVSRVNGPSAMLQNGKSAFAVSASLRFASSGINIPWETLVFMYEDLTYEPLQGIRFNDSDFSFSLLTWEELAFSYARIIYDRNGNQLSAGITGKLLFGLNGGYSEFRTVDYIAMDSKTVDFYKFQTNVAFAMPASGLASSFSHPFNSVGFGLGADIGITFIKKKNRYSENKGSRPCEFSYEDYLYKIGISILDLGRISFNKDTEYHVFNVENVSLNTDDLDTLKGMTADVGMRYLSSLMLGDSNASLKDDKMKIGLPTALSLQFDWHIMGSYYMGMIWIHPLHFYLKDTKRAAQLAIVPRYETRMLGVSMPVSLYQYERWRFGLALRFYTLTVGTECLGTILDFKDLDSIDLYFSLKFNLDKGRCNPSRFGACVKGRSW